MPNINSKPAAITIAGSGGQADFKLDQQDMTPSALWARAASIGPLGPEWTGDATRCVMCGVPVRAGDRAGPFSTKRFGPSFNFKPDCKHDGRAICGHCEALWTNQWMQTSSKSYAIAGQGVFELSNLADIARFVVQPPSAPYVAIFNTRKQAHLIWRTPVALPDHRWLQVRLDDEILQIDRLRVLESVRHWQAAGRILQACGKPRATPFWTSYNLATPMVGKPIGRHGLTIKAHSEEGRLAMEALESLTMADLWALHSLRDRPPEELTPDTLKAPMPRRVEVSAAGADDEDESPDEPADVNGTLDDLALTT